MQAWRIHEHGGLDVLRLEDAPTPTLRAGDVLVRVAAASANPSDWRIRQGQVRSHFQLHLPWTVGRDCAGTIAALGEGVTGFSVGDEIIGMATPGDNGPHAELARIPATAAARRPANIAPLVATTLGISALSAYIPLIELGKLRAGHRVLIHAGAGGVGHFAIQMARHVGAEVFTTCSTNNVEFCRGMGAHRAIDYTREDFTTIARDCDVVFDCLGGDAHVRSAPLLKPGGKLVYINADPIRSSGRDDIEVLHTPIMGNPERFGKILAWAASGVLKPHIDQVFDFANAKGMYAASEQGHGRGKKVLRVAQ
ncbi:MAG: NADP-dependent oxidoreductase [Burkholderiales bacterium]